MKEKKHIYLRALVRATLPCALLIALIALLAVLCGCHAAPAGSRVRVPIPRPDPVPTLTAHEVKDATITASADRIDDAAAAPEMPPALAKPITQETQTIRAAIAAAPAASIAQLRDRYTAALDQYEDTLEKVSAKLDKEELKTTRADKRWLRSTAIALLLAFAVSIIFGRQAAAARTWPLALLGLGLFALAEVIGSPWFQLGTLILLAGGVAYATFWVIQKHRDGTLAAKTQTRMDALREIVSTLDEAYDNANEDVRRIFDRNIFDRLSRRFQDGTKAEIHDIRKEEQTAHA